jgi:hypothetical protein
VDAGCIITQTTLEGHWCFAEPEFWQHPGELGKVLAKMC